MYSKFQEIPGHYFCKMLLDVIKFMIQNLTIEAERPDMDLGKKTSALQNSVLHKKYQLTEKIIIFKLY